MSQPIGNSFKTRIPTFSDDASIQEAFSVYHYGKDNYAESEAVPSNSIEGHFVTFNSRVGALESTVGSLSEDFVLKESPVATPNVIQPEDGSSTPLTIRGKSGQTAQLQNWQNATTTNIASIFNDGGAVFGNYLTIGNTAKSSTTALDLRIGNAAHKGITVAGVVSQTGNLQEWTSTNGSTTSVVARVSSLGKIFSNNGLTDTDTSEVVTESGTQILTNKTLTSPGVSNGFFTAPIEKITISAAASSGVLNYDLIDQTVLYYTLEATSDWTINFRGNSSTPLNSMISVGQSIASVFLSTQGSTAYKPSSFQIDGTPITVKWVSGFSPISGNPSSIDGYSFTIIKTSNNTFTVLAGAVQFK
jgi:hypothetical protein